MPDPRRTDDARRGVGAERGTLGSQWIADEIARAEAQDAAALARQEPERVSPAAALGAWLLAGTVLWGLAIGIGVGAVLILADPLGLVR